ncbi:MAG: hypothetical protein K0S74_1385 [Chlamydiales bacterium]|jgi:hypothetical protein|nr:hypothetical protein [Chlamydiales bacterium]
MILLKILNIRKFVYMLILGFKKEVKKNCCIINLLKITERNLIEAIITFSYKTNDE